MSETNKQYRVSQSPATGLWFVEAYAPGQEGQWSVSKAESLGWFDVSREAIEECDKLVAERGIKTKFSIAFRNRQDAEQIAKRLAVLDA